MENTEKKQSVKSLLDKGKASGRLTTHEIDAAIVEMDMDKKLFILQREISR